MICTLSSVDITLFVEQFH